MTEAVLASYFWNRHGARSQYRIVGSIFFVVLASIIFLRWMLQQEYAENGSRLDV